ncbi:MAG TPA: phytanoyl-CoA dioxygenase family protein [Myxococcota bacterium]|nr:phytanoyl-CoA dioxygenase family protein [Myxococcota bacterium]
MLSRAQREEFEARGLLWLRAAVDPGVVADLRARILEYLAQKRAIPESPPASFVIHAARTSRLMGAFDFAKTWGDSGVAAIDDMLGAGRWLVPQHAGQLLMMTWPNPGAEWRLPHKVWHLDYPAPAAATVIPGIQVFLFVDRIEPRSGGTLFVAGSHRLVDALRRRQPPDWPGASSEVRRSLAREVPWLRELWSLRPGEDRIARFMERVSVVAGGELQVVEAVGEPADVLVMHPWVLHAPAPNCGTRPRMLLTERIRLRTGGD